MDNNKKKSVGEKIADLIKEFAEKILDEERSKYMPCENAYRDEPVECACWECKKEK